MNPTHVRTSHLTANATRRAFAVVAIALSTLAFFGCTSRKQYAINEAILISERRQLEDEIYRTKFELRDALRENVQLREQLEKENPAAAQSAQKSTSRRPSNDDGLFPGGNMLNVDPSQTAPAYQAPGNPDVYDASPTRQGRSLPDFEQVPQGRYTRTNAPRQGAPAQLAQSRQAAPQRIQTRPNELNVRQVAQNAPNMTQARQNAQNVQPRQNALANRSSQQRQQLNDWQSHAAQPGPIQTAQAERSFGRKAPIVQASNLAEAEANAPIEQPIYEEPVEEAAEEEDDSVAGFEGSDWSPVGM